MIRTNAFKDGYCFLKASANSQTLRVSDRSTIWMYTSWNSQMNYHSFSESTEFVTFFSCLFSAFLKYINHHIPRLIDDVHPGLLCFIFVPTHHVDCPTWKPNTRRYFESIAKCAAESITLQHVPFLAIAMAVALPIPLLAPVTIKDLPTTDTFRSWGSKFLDAASYPFLKAHRKHTNQSVPQT